MLKKLKTLLRSSFQLFQQFFFEFTHNFNSLSASPQFVGSPYSPCYPSWKGFAASRIILYQKKRKKSFWLIEFNFPPAAAKKKHRRKRKKSRGFTEKNFCAGGQKKIIFVPFTLFRKSGIIAARCRGLKFLQGSGTGIEASSFGCVRRDRED